MGRAVFLVLLLLAAPVSWCGAACPSAGTSPATTAAVDPRLELHLADGRRLRLVGLDPAGSTPGDPDLAATSRAALAKAIAGKRIVAHPLSDKPDRWGRVPALAFIEGDPSPGGLTRLAIAAGLGRYLSEPAAHACHDTFLGAEAEARSAGLGLWRDPYYGVLAVDDRNAFAERSATIVVSEGQLWRVDAEPFRTKLRFAAPGEVRRGLLVAVVLPKIVKRFEEDGVRFEALIGRTVRLRGLLDLRFGPQVELAGPDALELIPNTTDAPATASAKP